MSLLLATFDGMLASSVVKIGCLAKASKLVNKPGILKKERPHGLSFNGLMTIKKT